MNTETILEIVFLVLLSPIILSIIAVVLYGTLCLLFGPWVYIIKNIYKRATMSKSDYDYWHRMEYEYGDGY